MHYLLTMFPTLNLHMKGTPAASPQIKAQPSLNRSYNYIYRKQKFLLVTEQVVQMSKHIFCMCACNFLDPDFVVFPPTPNLPGTTQGLHLPSPPSDFPSLSDLAGGALLLALGAIRSKKGD